MISAQYRRVYHRLETDAEYVRHLGMHEWIGIREYHGDALDNLAEHYARPQRRIIEVVE